MRHSLSLLIALALIGIYTMPATQALVYIIKPKYAAVKETVPESLIDSPTKPMMFTKQLEQVCHCDLRMASRYDYLYKGKSCDASCHESKPPKCPRWCTYYKPTASKK